MSVASIVVLAALVAGCGSSGQTTSTSTASPTAPRFDGPSDLLVTDADIAAAGQGSPYAALLRWWRDLQSQDVAAARTAYAKSVDTSTLGHEVRVLSYPPKFDYQGDHPLPSDALQRSRPFLITPTRHDRTARLFTTIDAAVFDTSDPSKVVFVSQTPAFFRLVREGGEWKLANDDYLALVLRVRPPSSR
jgi:hypothetical protein